MARIPLVLMMTQEPMSSESLEVVGEVFSSCIIARAVHPGVEALSTARRVLSLMSQWRSLIFACYLAC